MILHAVKEIFFMYQMEILGMAIERNTIVVVEAGYRRTQIMILLVKYIAQTLKMEGKKCLILLLAPTVALVKQYFEVIKKSTNLQVAYYGGRKAVKDWNEATLDEVLVMTPQILLNGLDSSSLTLDMVNLMVLDDCHEALKKHQYAKIMEGSDDFYVQEFAKYECYKVCNLISHITRLKVYQTTSERKPKIFGMSASLVTEKGFSSNSDCEKKITQLGDILDSKVYTLKDGCELDLSVHISKQITKGYSVSSRHQHSLKLKLVSLPQFKDNKAINIRENIEYCLENLGLFCAYKAVQLYREKEKSEVVTGTVETEQYALDNYLKDAHELFKEELPSDVNELFNTPVGIQNAFKGGILTHKVEQLVHLLIEKSGEDPKQFLCIVFVQRVIAAAVISSLIQKLDCLKCLKTDVLSSVTSTFGRIKQQKALDDFCAEKVQVLVATDVIEDGINVKNSNCVISFDLPSTLHSYIRYLGISRQENSEFILFLERGNEQQKTQLFNFITSVVAIEDTILSTNDISIKEKNAIEKYVPGAVDGHLPEMTLIRNVMPSIEEQNSVEKDVCKRLEESGGEQQLLQMTLNRNSIPCIEGQSVVEKGAYKGLDDVGKDLGGVRAREEKVGDDDEDLQWVIENKEEEIKVKKTSTKSGAFTSISNEDVESNHPKKRSKQESSLPNIYPKDLNANGNSGVT